MVQAIVSAIMIGGAAAYLSGYICSAVLAYRLKQWGWLIMLILFHGIAYPFFAVTHRKISKIIFRLFLIGLSLFLVGLGILAIVGPARHSV